MKNDLEDRNLHHFWIFDPVPNFSIRGCYRQQLYWSLITKMERNRILDCHLTRNILTWKLRSHITLILVCRISAANGQWRSWEYPQNIFSTEEITLVFRLTRCCRIQVLYADISAILLWPSSDLDIIKFTMETEINGKLPFLDILVKRRLDGRLNHTVYRKHMHTNRYIGAYMQTHTTIQPLKEVYWIHFHAELTRFAMMRI